MLYPGGVDGRDKFIYYDFKINKRHTSCQASFLAFFIARVLNSKMKILPRGKTPGEKLEFPFNPDAFQIRAGKKNMRRNLIKISDLESDILKRVRSSNSISRVELARSLELSPSTAGIYVERLIADGFLLETEKASLVERHKEREREKVLLER